MRRILLIFKNDVKRRLKSPYTIIILLLIPMMMTGIIGAIFAPRADSDALPKIKVLVVDKDKNIGSRFLLGAFDSPQIKEMFQVTLVDETRGKKLISRGKASALVIIPEKFTERLMDAEKSQIKVIKNPSEQFLPSVVEEFMNTTAVIVSGFVQVFATEVKGIRLMIDIPIENLEMAAMLPFMEAAQKKIIALQYYLDPLLIQLKEEITSEKKEKKKPDFNIFVYILPGMSIMFLLFIIEVFLRDILTEREDGKLQRMMFAPIRTMELVFARILSGWIMGIMVYLLIVVGGVLIFNISWGNYGHLFILIAVTCFWIAAFFALLNAFFKNKNQAGAFTSPIILVFSAFGGSFIQVEQLPESVNWISTFTLNHWFITGTQQINTGEFPTLPLTVILVSGVVLFASASIFLKKRITV
ncbi:MAG: ABC transporter permease [Candidatus Aminicenantes bacterium]|nr:ABC transporter permease [Candidatus Aminicenantes bacterium]NIM84673.1 ABC transporter permease [Candidatus Aminicenantes bacterium]NIN24172.1 ABC transporter permease [Candidatus Aminicenantes bacterium]NIN47897.1 ABC transporter permease [Candidatus Aminicenantes bacterium]NIN90835.1 ABC transporter permease [Candidatus Aminicenantes bacterium]